MKRNLLFKLLLACLPCSAVSVQAQEKNGTGILLRTVEAFYSNGAQKAVSVTPQEFQGAIAGIMKRGSEDKALFIAESKNEEKGDKYRCTMMRVLATVNDEAAARSLADNLADKNVQIRRCAAIMAGEQKNASTIPALLAALRDPDREVRASSAHSLGSMKARKAVAALKKGVNEPEQIVAISSIWSLGEIGDKSSDELLIKRLATADETTKSNILAALGKIRSKKSVAELKRLASSETEPETIRMLAKEYLGPAANN